MEYEHSTAGEAVMQKEAQKYQRSCCI